LALDGGKLPASVPDYFTLTSGKEVTA